MDSTSVSSSAAQGDPDRINNKKLKIRNSSLQDVNDKLPAVPVIQPVPAIRLCEDELSLIFSKSCLSTRDLLTFRLVNKTWRDAATSALLRRDACCFAVNIEDSADYPGNDETRTRSRIYFGRCVETGKSQKRKKIVTLTQLTDVMSKSTKFPASDLHLLGHTNSPSQKDLPGTKLSLYLDLITFFKLHGDQIKTVIPHGFIFLESLLDILSTYTTNIQCLDLREARPASSPLKRNKSEETRQFLENDSKVNSIKCLVTGGNASGYDGPRVHRLLSSLPNLVCIENVEMATLPHILKDGKGHLIRSFQYNIPLTTEFRWNSEQQQLQNFAKINPQLTKLSVCVGETSCSNSTLISALLESSKDTLQHMSLSISEMSRNQNKLTILPMKNLKSITLKERSRLNNAAETERLINVDPSYFVYQDGASAQKCFPSLYKLRVLGSILEESIINFFGLQPDNAGNPINSLPQVQVLEMQYSRLPKNFDNSSTLLSKFFPNLRVLKLKSEDFKRLENSVWVVFPLVEFFEIDFYAWQWWSKDISYSVDQFFTGFSPEMCSKLQTAFDELPEPQLEPLNRTEVSQFQRIAPSVCDLRHLKELKMKFSGRIKSQFASRVTGIYAFFQMPTTKFIISYDPECFNLTKNWGSEADMNQKELCFASIKPYVQIVQEKKPASPSEWEQ